jgi:glutaredoxin
MEKDNVTMVLNHFVAALAIPLTRKSLNDELQRHPDYYSLLAISEVLDNWHIPNEAYTLTFDELLAADIDGPFIAFVKAREFLTIHRLNEKEAIVSNEYWNKHRLSIAEFKQLYTGSILVAEKDEISGEADYAAKHRKEIVNNLRVPFIITGSTVLLLIWLLFRSPYLTTLNWQIALLTLVKTAGLITTILLLVQSIDSNNPLINYLCGGENKGCNAILSSKAAKITEELSWSEVGFFYFGGSWLVLLLYSNVTSVIALLALLNVLSLPYTFYSIFHQWKIAKQWCKLCCTVQALLWLEFAAFLPSILNGIHTPSLSDFASLITGMAIPVLAWVFLKPYLLLSKQIKPLKGQLRKYKYNKNLFKGLLNEEAKYALLDKESSLIIGNAEAENVITMVSNPFCQPCAKTHKQLEWLKRRDDVMLQVVFATENDTDNYAEVAWHLLAMQQDRNDTSLEKALDTWYELKIKDFAAWAKVHPKTTTVENDGILEKHREWCALTEIKGTPTLFLNGRKIPQDYKPEDLKYFI